MFISYTIRSLVRQQVLLHVLFWKFIFPGLKTYVSGVSGFTRPRPRASDWLLHFFWSEIRFLSVSVPFGLMCRVAGQVYYKKGLFFSPWLTDYCICSVRSFRRSPLSSSTCLILSSFSFSSLLLSLPDWSWVGPRGKLSLIYSVYYKHLSKSAKQWIRAHSCLSSSWTLLSL